MKFYKRWFFSKPTKDDFILASFPKSGNTWISFIIANIYNLSTGKYQEIDFFNIHDINPELGLEPISRSAFPEFPQIYLTHERYRSTFRNVILMIRDPWDVMYSYYHYLKGERKSSLSLSEVITHDRFGICALIRHNQSFFKKCNHLNIITYEKMQSAPLKQIKLLVEFLELDIDEKILLESIQRSCFKTMRETEIKKGRKYGTPGFLFTRKGKVGEGRKIIGENEEMDLFIRNQVKGSLLLSYLYSEPYP